MMRSMISGIPSECRATDLKQVEVKIKVEGRLCFVFSQPKPQP